MKRYFLCLNDFYILLTIRHFFKEKQIILQKNVFIYPLFSIPRCYVINVPLWCKNAKFGYLIKNKGTQQRSILLFLGEVSPFINKDTIKALKPSRLTVWPESLGPKTPKRNLKTPKKTPLWKPKNTMFLGKKTPNIW